MQWENYVGIGIGTEIAKGIIESANYYHDETVVQNTQYYRIQLLSREMPGHYHRSTGGIIATEIGGIDIMELSYL